MGPTKSPSRICAWAKAPATSKTARAVLPECASTSSHRAVESRRRISGSSSSRNASRSRHPRGVARSTRVTAQSRVAEYLHEPGVLRVGADGEEDEAVGRRHGSVGCDARVIVTESPRGSRRSRDNPGPD